MFFVVIGFIRFFLLFVVFIIQSCFFLIIYCCYFYMCSLFLLCWPIKHSLCQLWNCYKKQRLRFLCGLAYLNLLLLLVTYYLENCYELMTVVTLPYTVTHAVTGCYPKYTTRLLTTSVNRVCKLGVSGIQSESSCEWPAKAMSWSRRDRSAD